MHSTLQSRLAADRLGTKIRWALIAAAVILLAEHLSSPFVLGVLALLALTNIYGQRICADPAAYARNGSRISFFRHVDALALGLSTFYGPIGQSLLLLGVPVLVTEALVSRKRCSVAFLVMVITGVAVAGGIVRGVELTRILLPGGVLVAAGAFSIILASYKARDEYLISHDHRLATILDCSSAIAAGQGLNATLLHVLKAAVRETGADCGYLLFLSENDPGFLQTEIAYSESGEFQFPKRIEIGASMSGMVAKIGQPIVLADAGGTDHDCDGVTAGVHAAVSVPLITKTYQGGGEISLEEVLGVMTLLSLQGGHSFQPDDVDLLRALASLLAVSVANAKIEQKRRMTFLQTLESLAKSLEARDEYTQGHSQRVCELSLLIAERMGLWPEALEEIRVGTLLHDIGKIGVPDAVLNKPSKLTSEEFEIMKTHTIIGYEICKPLQLSEGVLLLIRNHHEKLDGSGYPDGLKGGELPLPLRIVCVADAFDAMSSRRPYRGVMDRDKIMSEMSRCAGTQFDPVVVEILKDLYVTGNLAPIYKNYWANETKAA